MSGTHGLSTYAKGYCRCVVCRAAMATWQNERRRQRDPAAVRHGTRNGYVNYLCRCQPCRDANRLYMAAYQARRRAAR